MHMCAYVRFFFFGTAETLKAHEVFTPVLSETVYMTNEDVTNVDADSEAFADVFVERLPYAESLGEVDGEYAYRVDISSFDLDYHTVRSYVHDMTDEFFYGRKVLTNYLTQYDIRTNSVTGEPICVDVRMSRELSDVLTRAAYIDEFMAPYIEEANTYTNDADKVRYLVQVVDDTFDYDYSYYVRDVYDGLLTGKAVCRAYADLFHFLCYECGIPCECVYGEVVLRDGTTEQHVWNRVFVDGAWYCVDATFQDGDVFESWVLKSEEWFLEHSHIPWP